MKKNSKCERDDPVCISFDEFSVMSKEMVNQKLTAFDEYFANDMWLIIVDMIVKANSSVRDIDAAHCIRRFAST